MITCNIATIGNKDLPQAWNELNAEQYTAVFKVLAQHHETDQAYLLHILLLWWRTSAEKLAGINWFKALRSKGNITIPPLLITELQEEIFPEMRFVFDKEKKCTTNHLAQLRHQNVLYAGPADMLLDVTGAEMEVVEYCYASYIALKRSRKHEVLLCAALWREMEHGRKRPFDKDEVHDRATQLASLPDEVITAMRFFYESCMYTYHQRYKKIFKKSEEGDRPDPQAWRKLNRALAGEKRGTVEEVRAMKLDDIFLELNELERDRQAMKDFYEKLKQRNND